MPRKNIVDDSCIVLVIEGADKFINFQNYEIIPIDYWLPQIFPDRIKCIVTINDDSPAADYFSQLGAQFVNLQPA